MNLSTILAVITWSVVLTIGLGRQFFVQDGLMLFVIAMERRRAEVEVVRPKTDSPALDTDTVQNSSSTRLTAQWHLYPIRAPVHTDFVE